MLITIISLWICTTSIEAHTSSSNWIFDSSKKKVATDRTALVVLQFTWITMIRIPSKWICSWSRTDVHSFRNLMESYLVQRWQRVRLTGGINTSKHIAISRIALYNESMQWNLDVIKSWLDSTQPPVAIKLDCQYHMDAHSHYSRQTLAWLASPEWQIAGLSFWSSIWKPEHHGITQNKLPNTR